MTMRFAEMARYRSRRFSNPKMAAISSTPRSGLVVPKLEARDRRCHLEGPFEAALPNGDAPMVVPLPTECGHRRAGRHRRRADAPDAAHRDHRVPPCRRNLKLAQQLARHASIQTTADVYGHLDDVDLERALERMEPAGLAADNHSDRHQLFPPPTPTNRSVDPNMEAAGIEPASAVAPTERLRA